MEVHDNQCAKCENLVQPKHIYLYLQSTEVITCFDPDLGHRVTPLQTPLTTISTLFWII